MLNAFGARIPFDHSLVVVAGLVGHALAVFPGLSGPERPVNSEARGHFCAVHEAIFEGSGAKRPAASGSAREPGGAV
jgi:hypothetical protein